MELRIKTGEDIQCSYSGKVCNTLVKISPVSDKSEGGESLSETGWIGREALLQALNLINSVEQLPLAMAVQPQAQVVAPVVQPAADAYQTPQVASSPVGPVSNRVQMDMEADRNQLNVFEKELIELIENPPQTSKNGGEGLGEQHVRELVARYKRTFRNPKVMGTVLLRHLGVSPERFELFLR